MPPKRLALLSLIYYKSGKNYLADQDATVEQLSVGYFSQSKGLNVVLDSIRSKINLTEKDDWRKQVKKLFKKKDPSKQKEKVQKNTQFTESDNADVKTDAKSKSKKTKQKVESNGKLDKLSKSAAKTQQPEKNHPEAENDEVSNVSDESDESDGDVEEEIDGQNTAAPTTVDDFFITADGTNYLSTAVISRNQEEGSDDDGAGHLPRSTGFEKKSRESSFFHKSDKKPVKLAVNRFDGSKRKFTNEGDNQICEKKQTKIDPELHPSWQAKQKLKPTITEFKGKKITFD